MLFQTGKEPSISYYKQLLQSFKIPNIVNKFKNQFTYDDISEYLYNEIYLIRKRPAGVSKVAEDRYNLCKSIPVMAPLCKECSNFYLNMQRQYIKTDDINYAHFFENAIKSFFNSKGIHTVRGDDSRINSLHHSGFPDLMVVDEKSGREICYCEVKYNAAPFIKVRNYVQGRECYEGSLTLNPQKLERQRMLIEATINVPVYYVYWADFPCLKGVFFTEIQNIWNYYRSIGHEEQHDRKTAAGDFSYGRKIGQTEIIYPPVLEMKDFETLLTTINNLFANEQK